MTTPATPIFIPPKAQEGFLALKRSYMDSFNNYENIRDRFLNIDIAIAREKDGTVENYRAKIANRLGNSNKFQNVTIPIMYPQVESAVEYQTEVFLSGYPIFSFIADPVNADAALQMNTIMEENSIRGGWSRQLQMFFRDGFKYNLCALECSWDTCVTPTFETIPSQSSANVKEVIWSGNTIKRVDLYNAFWDKRVAPADMATDGEHFGYNMLFSRTKLKAYINSLPGVIRANIVKALESTQQAWGATAAQDIYSYYTPQIRRDFSPIDDLNAEPDWLAWVGAADGDDKIKYKNSYVITILYARIIPADFNLRVAAEQTPQIWKLTYVNNNVLLAAERMTNAHNLLPVLMGQPLEDGLDYQTKSLAENVEPIQDVTSAMMNSVMAARRRAISDRTLYDPSRIAEQHINSPNPSAKIPVKPAAYGKPLGEAVYAFPFRDDQSGLILQEIQQVSQLADQTTGQNRTRRGQFQKGNKTLKEFQTVDDNSTGRDRMTSILLEDQVMTPLKQMLKINIIQYQGVAEIFSRELQKNVNIDPVKLRNTALAFKVSDGLLPSSKIISSDALNVGFQTLAAVPTLAQGYNLPPMFSYLMKTQNADIASFEKGAAQQAYEQAVAQWNNMITLAIEKGVDTSKLPPQPTPDKFGYDPNAQLQAPGSIPNAGPQTTPAAQLPNQSSQVIQKGSTNYPTQQ
jgi:hypothetical protein